LSNETKNPKIDLSTLGNKIAEFFYDPSNYIEGSFHIKNWETFIDDFFEKIKKEHAEVFKTKDDLERVLVSLDVSKVKTISGLEIGEQFARPKGFIEFPCSAILYSSICPGIFPPINYTTFKSSVYLADQFKSFAFSKVQFEGEFKFDSNFVNKVISGKGKREDDADFYLSFNECVFYKVQIFNNYFGSKGHINFLKSVFKEDADFSNSKLSNRIGFDRVKFERNAYFQEIRFSNPSFLNCFDDESEKTLTNKLSFKNSLFKGFASFTQEKNNDSKVEICLDEAVFEGPVIFNLNFLECPDFSKAHFLSHVQIEETWQIDSKRIQSSDEPKFRFLKKYFAEQGNHFKEQEYFSYELMARQKMLVSQVVAQLGFFKILKNSFNSLINGFETIIVPAFEGLKSFSDLVLFSLYKLLSNFGMSVFRPLFAIVFSVCYFGYLFDNVGIQNPYVKSFSRTFSLIMPMSEDCQRWPVLLVFLTVQSLVNAALLFLLFLGIRNKFKIK
jgi:hypothetical protein